MWFPGKPHSSWIYIYIYTYIYNSIYIHIYIYIYIYIFRKIMIYRYPMEYPISASLVEPHSAHPTFPFLASAQHRNTPQLNAWRSACDLRHNVAGRCLEDIDFLGARSTKKWGPWKRCLPTVMFVANQFNSVLNQLAYHIYHLLGESHSFWWICAIYIYILCIYIYHCMPVLVFLSAHLWLLNLNLLAYPLGAPRDSDCRWRLGRDLFEQPIDSIEYLLRML